MALVVLGASALSFAASEGLLMANVCPRRRPWLRWGGGAVVILLMAGSIGLNLVLFRYALSRYKSEQRVRMDPTGAALYVRPNADLPPPEEEKPRVVLFGDSRISLWSPVIRLDRCEIVNRGWSGETTSQGLLRLDRDVIALRPRMVLIQEGINDLKGIGLFTREEDAIVDQWRRTWRRLCRGSVTGVWR